MEKTIDIETFILSSKILKQDRVINAWRPTKFNNQSLPVLYLLDGGLNEKFHEIRDILENLIIQDTIIPIQLIGIENIDRNYDFTGNTTVRKDRKWVPKYGNAPRFKRFIIEELIPIIDNKYKTNQDNTIIGESLGGLLVLDILYHHPNQFQRFISIDPSLWWNNHLLLDKILEDLETINLKDKSLWVGASQVVSISELTDQLFLRLGDNSNLLGCYSYEKYMNQNHFTIFNHCINDALIWIFSD